jgi:hypothetical protein
MTLQGDNCRYYNFPNTRPTYMCSVANKVELAFPINGGVIEGVLNVELAWSKDTKQDTFKCQGNTEGDIDAMMWTDFRRPLSEAMTWPEKQILPFVFCTDDPASSRIPRRPSPGMRARAVHLSIGQLDATPDSRLRPTRSSTAHL